MARGFESKSVADQQEASLAAAPAERGEPGGDPLVLARRRRLELSRSDVLQRLDAASAEPHREMLRRALSALDAELASLG